MTDQDTVPDCSSPSGGANGQLWQKIFALLDREAELQERIGAIDMEERILRIPGLKAHAERVCAMSPAARDRAIEDVRTRVDHLEQDIEARLETARRQS